MGAIEIKTSSPQQATPLLRNAIELEKKLIRDSLMLTNERITELGRRAGVELDQLLAGTVARHEDNEMLLIELEGELAIRESLEESLRHLDSLQICG
ncbi:MAG TPA: hypothetical protein VN666_17890 [Nitrospira sp.]|nr:hypothetical protein [Nitrospira sp.]